MAHRQTAWIRQSANDGTSRLLAAFLSAAIAFCFMVANHGLIHWFIIPVTVCGVIIGIDLVEWLRGRIGLLDPNGLLGLLGYHFFFLAPLLMVIWNYRMKYLPDQPEDYRSWLGGMAILNCAGLLIYRWTRKKSALRILRSQLRKPIRSMWKIEPKRFWVLFSLFTVVSCGTQIWIFISLGGIRGYMNMYTNWLAGQDLFRGTALVFSVAESFPILLMIGIAVWARNKQKSWFTLASLFCVLAVLELVAGGLRGSRGNVIWSLFWIAGMVHLYIRRLPRVVALIAICALYGFVSLYAAYKLHGTNLLDQLALSGDYTSTISDTAEGPATVLVGDFSRSDVQAYLLYKITNQQIPEYALGQSYLGALTMLIPHTLWENRPPTVVKWTTNAEYGTGAYESGYLQSSRIYGIAGEAMLNFGPIGLLLAYAVFGALVARIRVFMRTLQSGDSRLLMIPFVINSLFLLLLSDSDNCVFYLVKYGLMPVSLIILTSSYLKLKGRSHGNTLRSNARSSGFSYTSAL